MTTRRGAALAVAVVLLVAVAATALLLGRRDDPARAAAPRPTPTSSTPTPSAAPVVEATPLPTPTPTPTPTRTVTKKARPSCTDTVARAFTPTTIAMTGRSVSVVAVPRDADDVPGTPPLTSAGKWQVAFDPEQGIRPGDAAGHVLLNAHTWPDGSALGNRLLDRLQPGDRIVVGDGSQRLCYRVAERVEVLASEGLPRYYDTTGPPALAIVVCSGRRLGPGHWEKRTIWFAEPAR